MSPRSFVSALDFLTQARGAQHARRRQKPRGRGTKAVAPLGGERLEPRLALALNPATGLPADFPSAEELAAEAQDIKFASGLPADMTASAYLFIGDHSVSNSEIWRMNVAGKPLTAPSWGDVRREQATFARGVSYPIKVHWLDSNRAAGPDYDYRAWIDRSANPTWTSGSPTPSSPDFFVTDPGQLLQRRWFGSDVDATLLTTNPPASKTAEVHFPGIDLDVDSDNSGSVDGSPAEDALELVSTTGVNVPVSTASMAGLTPLALGMSDNLRHAATTGQVSFTFSSTAPTAFRLWRDAARTLPLPWGTAVTAAQLGLGFGGRLNLQLEAVTQTSSFAAITTTALVTGGIWQGTLQDTVRARGVPGVDLDVDSDNDGALMRSLLEDREEDAGVANGSTTPTKPGLIVPVGGSRAPMIVDVPAGRTASLAITQGADKVRLWPAPTGGTAIAATGTTIVGGPPQTFWIEAFAASASLADIAFTLTATGSGPASSDTVRATAAAVDLDVDSNNDGTVDPDNGPEGTDDRIEDDPETPGVRLPVQGQRSEMRLASANPVQPTVSRLQIDSGADNVELWDASTGGTRLTLDDQDGINWAAGQRPAAVWIQGVRPSDEVGDIRFTLTETFGTSSTPITDSDTVRATAMAEVILFLHFDTQTALEELEDSLPPPTLIDQTGMLVLTPADSAALQARRAAWLAGHLGTPAVPSTVKSFAELENAVTAAEGKLASARAAAAAMTNMRQQPSLHTSAQYLSAVELALYSHDEYLHAVQVAQKVQANFLADQTWISSWDEALLRRFFALPERIDGLEADITPQQWQGLTDSFDSVRASLDRLEDNLGRAAGGLRAARDVLAGGAIAVGAVVILPVGVAVYAGGTILAGGAILSGAKRWNEGQSELEVVFGAAADTSGVTSFSLGLWGTDPVTGQEVALTAEAGTYELIVGASSISMLVGMPFANGLRGPTTRIPVPKAQVQFVESFSVVGDTVVASPVRFPTITWTEGIEVSHQGVAIASAYAGTTRIVAVMASGPGNNPNLVGSAAQTELRDVGTLQGKTRAEIEHILQQRGYTAVPSTANDGGKIWTKSFADGSTAAVRIDPGNISLPQGYAGRVAHAHKEIVPSAKVVNGNYHPRFATTLDDLGNQSTNPYSIHIGIIW